MKVVDLEGKRIYISQNSITVKDENDKTRGIVRNIKTRSSLQSRELFDWSTKFKKLGLDLMNRYIVKGLLIVDGEAYYLHDLGYDDSYTTYWAPRPELFEREVQKYQEEHELMGRISAAGIPIVNCYIRRCVKR